MMTKHRIGRVQLPWANLEPPIRSPDYYKNLEEKKRLAAAPEPERQRRGKSVDLGSVGLPPHCCILCPANINPRPPPSSAKNSSENQTLVYTGQAADPQATLKKSH
jgi:hypothetical protein